MLDSHVLPHSEKRKSKAKNEKKNKMILDNFEPINFVYTKKHVLHYANALSLNEPISGCTKRNKKKKKQKNKTKREMKRTKKIVVVVVRRNDKVFDSVFSNRKLNNSPEFMQCKQSS